MHYRSHWIFDGTAYSLLFGLCDTLFAMTTNAFSISRRLVDRGVDKSTANAVAEEIVTHSDEHLATKSDIARLEGQISSLTIMAKLNMGLTVGLYVGLVVLIVDKLVG